MAKIICKINPGLLYQTLYIESQKYNGKKLLETFSMPLQAIPLFIVQQKDIKDVYMSGMNEEFLIELQYKVHEKEISLYNTNTKIFHYT